MYSASLEGMETIPNTLMQQTCMHASCPLMRWRRGIPNSLERLLQATSSSQFSAVITARELSSVTGTYPQCKLGSGGEWHWFILDENPQRKKKKKQKKMFTLQVEIQGRRSYYSLFFVCLFGLFRKAQENRSFGTFTE